MDSWSLVGFEFSTKSSSQPLLGFPTQLTLLRGENSTPSDPSGQDACGRAARRQALLKKASWQACSCLPMTGTNCRIPGRSLSSSKGESLMPPRTGYGVCRRCRRRSKYIAAQGRRHASCVERGDVGAIAGKRRYDCTQPPRVSTAVCQAIDPTRPIRIALSTPWSHRSRAI